jgi:Ca-activated chloride channel family protein
MHLVLPGHRFLLSLLACSCFLHSQGTRVPSQSKVAEAFDRRSDCSSCRADIRVDSTLVQIPVSVTDRRGSFIQGLTRGTFRIFEDGIEQEVSAFSSGDIPVSVGLIFDTSGSMATRLTMARRAVAQFLKTTNPEDEFFLLRFDSRPGSVSGFTHSARSILDEVGRPEAHGSTALLDAVYLGLREIKKGNNPRRAMVIISDGEDNHSRYPKRAINTMTRESDVQIYAIGIHRMVYSRQGRIQREGAELLRHLCVDTGGRSFEIDDECDLPGIAARIGLEIRNEYLLGYRPMNQNWDGKYRHITVKLVQPPEIPHLRAYWRRGYYAPHGTGQ